MSIHYSDFVHSSTLLSEGCRFVAWREEQREKDGEPVFDKSGKAAMVKRPYNPTTGRWAKPNDPETWGSLPAAKRRAVKLGGKGGVGVMLGDLGNDLWLRGIDLDSCLDGGTLAPWAAEVVERFATRTEISPSGKGLKLYFLTTDRGAMDTRARVSFTRGDHCEMAIDFDRRFYAMTGDLWEEPLVGPQPGLRIVSHADLAWFVETAGPAFMGRRKSIRDESDSAVLFRLAWRLKAEGATFDDFLAAIDDDDRAAAHVAKEGDRAMKQAWKNAPAPRDRTASFDDDVREFIGLPVADGITGRLNRSHAVVQHKGKTLIATFSRDVDLGAVEDLHHWYANDLVPTGRNGAAEPASKHWMRDPLRRQYQGIVFDPSDGAPSDALNLWSGWGVEPNWDASCDLILGHIRDVVADGKPERERYTLGWLAHMVQRPGEKPGVALVLKGGKGAGKDTLADILRPIVGKRHIAHIDKSEHLTNRFNAPFASALLVHVEEAYWAGSQADKGTLQSLITSPWGSIERKGIDRISVDSFLRLLMTTNETWAVPASHDERRYAVFDVSDSRIGDRAYFDALRREIEGDGPAAFLAFLMTFDLDGFVIRDAPQTDALRDQKLATLRGIEAWWSGVLHDGALGNAFYDWEEAPIRVERAHLRAAYEHFMRDNRHMGRTLAPAEFGKALKAMVPTLEAKRLTTEARPWGYALPSLSECREMFAAWFKAPVDWEGA